MPYTSASSANCYFRQSCIAGTQRIFACCLRTWPIHLLHDFVFSAADFVMLKKFYELSSDSNLGLLKREQSSVKLSTLVGSTIFRKKLES